MPKSQLLFSAIFGFRNPSKEIFSELDEINAQGPIFARSFQKTEGESKWGHEAPPQQGGAAQVLAARPWRVGPPWLLSGTSSMLWNLPGKIGCWVLISSDSENISLLGFLKPKTAENSNWLFGILLIG